MRKNLLALIAASAILLTNCLETKQERTLVPTTTKEEFTPTITQTASTSPTPSATYEVIQTSRPELPTPTPYPTSVSGATVRLMEKYAHSTILTQTVKGIEISVANVRATKDELLVDFCHQAPTNYEWVLANMKIHFENFTLVPNRGITLARLETLSSGEKRLTTYQGEGLPPKVEKIDNLQVRDYICETRTFRLKDAPIPSHITLTIEDMMGFPHEGKECEETIDSTQSILDYKKSGIKVSCHAPIILDSGGISAGIFISEKPADMDNETAKKYLREIHLQLFRIYGPWVFESDVITDF